MSDRGSDGPAEDQISWRFDCESCDTLMVLTVVGCDEQPIFCPMCGDDMNEDWSEEDV